MNLRIFRSSARKPLLRILFAGVLLAGAEAADPTPASHVTDGTPATSAGTAAAIARAEALDLAHDPQWLALLHYAPSLLGERSVVDDPAFFIAARGKDDPHLELVADLQALLNPEQPKIPFIDRFPARAAFLCERLDIPRSALPVGRAAECETAIAGMRPRGTTLVFASGYLSTPASMFGHTLLLVRNGYGSLALAQAVNYAAATDTKNGLAFAVKGIFGGYDGYFSLLPYYQKLGEYTDLDQRDLWEYDLNLDDTELRRLLLHIWEMRHIGSAYYFFDENCSYRLLFLLDAARPSLELRRKTSLWVIPLDTVKLIRQGNLVTEIRHRPSRMTRVRAQAAALGERQQLLVDLAEGRITPDQVTGPDQDRILDATAEYLNSRLSKGRVGLEDYQNRLIAVLSRRAALGIKREPVAVPRPVPPDEGHPSGRISASLGKDGDSGFAELGLRPAYHDLLDPPAGFSPGSSIDFAQVTVRWYERERPELHRFDAVSLVSLTPVDALYQPKSFTISGGLVNEPTRSEDGSDDGRRRRAYLDGGPGYALAIPGGMAYALVEGELRIGTEAPTCVLGLGPTLGAAVTATDRWQLQLHSTAHPGIIGDRVGHGEVHLGQRYQLAARWSLAGEAGWQRSWGVDAWHYQLGIHAFF